MKLRPPARERQVGPAAGAPLRLLRWLATFAAAAAFLLLIAALLLAWRLSAGPVDVTDTLRSLLGSRAPQVAIGRATLRWPGWRDPEASFVLTLSNVSLPAAGGTDELTHGAISFAPAELLRLSLRPRALDLRGGVLHLVRRADGTIEIAPGIVLDGGRRAGPDPTASLERIDVRGLTIALTGASGHEGTLEIIHAHAERRGRSGPSGELRAMLAASGANVPIEAHLKSSAATGLLSLHTSPIDASSLAWLDPDLAGWHTSAAASLDASLDRHWHPLKLHASLTLGAGSIGLGGGDVPLQGGKVDIAIQRQLQPGAAGRLHARLSSSLTLAGTSGGKGPTLTADGVLDGALGGRLAGGVDLRASALPLADAGTWWPPGLARGGRRWVVQNLTAGTASNVAVHVTLASDDGPAGLAVTAVGGGLDGTGVTLHWLRPIPPITDADVHLQIDNEDSLTMTMPSGRQGALDISGSRMRITGLRAADQPGDIDVRVRGPLPSVLGVLAEKRLRLLSRQPIPLEDPAGTVDARLHVALPLDDRVTMAQVAIEARASLAAVHLSDVAFGRAIDDGAFTLAANADGLNLKGRASFAQLPIVLALGLDFRAGPPSQVTEHAHVTTTADAASIRQASPRLGDMLGGAVSLSADYRLHRDRRASVLLEADLTEASLATPFGWSKAAGPPGTLHAALTLSGDRLRAVDELSATGPDLDIASRGIEGPDGPTGLALDRLRVGRTQATGRLEFPAAGAPLRVVLSGPELDLGGLFGATGPRTRRAPVRHPPGNAQPWSAKLAFTRVTLAHHIDIGGVHADLAGRGLHLQGAEGKASGPVPATGSLAASGNGRALSLRTSDAGGLLSAFDLTDRIRGGSLSVTATLTNGALDDGIDGTVDLDHFTLLRVPAVVRLLRDMTVYGLADPAPKPDISVRSVIIPFDWRAGLLTIRHARASQPALGLTAKGTIDTHANALDLAGTIVPAYAFNTLPGRIPVVGRLFSPERGGGLFAATFTLKGPANAPSVKVNPLAALLPGMLRDLLPQ